MFKLDRNDILDIIENASAWIVVMAMFLYGFGKTLQFKGAMDVVEPVALLTGQQLMWAFYGYSRPFVMILGCLEVFGGCFILFKKTRIIGCFIITTILVNVILQDVFYGVNEGALRAAMIYQTLILWIFWRNREKLLDSLKQLMSYSKIEEDKKKRRIKFLLAVLIFVILRLFEFYIT